MGSSLVMRRLTVVLISGLVALLPGCGTTLNEPVHAYPGKPRPLNELTEIRIPPGINLIAVDNVEYQHGEAGPDGVPLYLTPGRHQLVVNYSELYGDITAAVPYTSDTFVFTPEVQAGERYRFAHNGPDDPVSADITTAEVDVWLVNTQGGQRLQASRRLPAGNFLTSLLGQAAPVVVATPTTAPTPSAPPAPAPTTPAAEPTPAAGGAVLDELRKWWQQASPTERAEFRKWIVDHP